MELAARLAARTYGLFGGDDAVKGGDFGNASAIGIGDTPGVSPTGTGELLGVFGGVLRPTAISLLKSNELDAGEPVIAAIGWALCKSANCCLTRCLFCSI